MQIDPMFGRQPAETHDLDVTDPASQQSVDPPSVDPIGPTPEESWSLESLEADIAAVGSAMETVDRIVAGVSSGAGSVGSAAAEIAAVVSHERFGTPGSVIS
jgi:hypothetical protein